uniref:Uncharacterized protein n=1 Tax=Romanomermis culicivorax TaxID=13658 RepID=A0A915I6V1_ROMCU
MNFIFMILLMIGGGLTVVGLVTPVWRHFIATNAKFNVSDPNFISTMQIMNISLNNLNGSDNKLVYEEISYGLISASCGSNGTFESCKNYFY